MIILDTNVVSELVRPVPETSVIDWLDSLAAAEVATSAITAAEMLYGVARLPSGHRKTALAAAIRALVDEDFADRVVPFDVSASDEYAFVVADCEERGRTIAIADAQIAATCRARQARLATRNTSHFQYSGVELIDPWQALC